MNKAMVEIAGFGEFEETLEKSVDVGGLEEIFGSSDVGDFLGSIVDDDREMVGGADVLAGENEVAETGGLDMNEAADFIVKAQWPDKLGGFLSIESPRGFAV